MEEYQEIKGTTAIFFQLAYSSTTFRNENGTFKKYAFGSDRSKFFSLVDKTYEH